MEVEVSKADTIEQDPLGYMRRYQNIHILEKTPTKISNLEMT
jgi:hypothetical protein